MLKNRLTTSFNFPLGIIKVLLNLISFQTKKGFSTLLWFSGRNSLRVFGKSIPALGKNCDWKGLTEEGMKIMLCVFFPLCISKAVFSSHKDRCVCLCGWHVFVVTYHENPPGQTRGRFGADGWLNSPGVRREFRHTLSLPSPFVWLLREGRAISTASASQIPFNVLSGFLYGSSEDKALRKTWKDWVQQDARPQTARSCLTVV